ncbi:hypothetical protein GOBAR_AA16268 [Gossypium barbadense]|uniref:Syntaxin N-terminal domain-containing protein n=1 Tax=Gossypium barbadense TaxID=3634 RepID=A0A2P5XM39_GOSBA|nr:hypothetical protein GOBAR_AA16268 [Gossypium barbadense]
MLRFPVSVKLEVLELKIWLIISKREAKFLPETCKASKKVADAKLAKDFQAVLKEFQKAQRLAAERETSYAPSVLKAVLPLRNGSDDLKLLHPITVRLHLAAVDQFLFLQNNLRGCIEVKAANLYQ